MRQIIPYELFAADHDKGPLWLETITGLDQAENRMKERSAKEPGDYFIYNVREGALISRLHTLEGGLDLRVE